MTMPTDEDAPVGKHGPYGSHTATDGSPAPSPATTPALCQCGHDERQHESACWACRREGRSCLYFAPVVPSAPLDDGARPSAPPSDPTRETQYPANHANGTPSTASLRATSELPELAIAYLAGAKDERGHFFAFHCGRADDAIETSARNYVELSQSGRPASDAPAPPRAMTPYPSPAPVDPPIPHCPYCGKLSTSVCGDAFLGIPKCDSRCRERAASPAQEATPPREEQHQGWTKNDQQQEPTLSQDAKVWPAELTTDEKELLRLGIVHALVHHQDQRKQFAKDANDPRFKRHRAGCLRVASHHQEEIYKLGELAAKIGMRNGWPRPEA